jgi:hypothetical protein
MSFNPNQTSLSSFTDSINQTAHGFVVGDVVRNNAGTWVKSQANNAVNSEVFGIVTTVAGANDFTITISGSFSLSGLTAGARYFLSPTTAGAYTVTEPTTIGQVSKPIFFAVSTTEAFWYNMRGSLLGAGVDSDTVQVLTATGSATAFSSLVIVNSATPVTVTLPQATVGEIGKKITIKNIGTGAVTIAGFAGDTVDVLNTLNQNDSNVFEVRNTNQIVLIGSTTLDLAAEYGYIILSNQTSTSGTLEDVVGGNIPLTPGAWEITYTVTTDHTSGANSSAHLAITDSANNVIDGSRRTRGGGVTVADILSATVQVTVTANETYKLRKSDGGGGTLSIFNSVLQQSTITYKKIGGYLPVIGQTAPTLQQVIQISRYNSMIY